MLWLKMQRRTVGTAIDLCDLGLDRIEETETEYRIGAMVPLRALEQHAGLSALTHGAMEEAVRHIVGVQFRNCATLGGSLWGRFGFSDVLTLLLALDATVVLHHAGALPLADFAALPRDDAGHPRRRCACPRRRGRVAYLSQRNISTDFPVLAVRARPSGTDSFACVDRRAADAGGPAWRTSKGPARAGRHGGERRARSRRTMRPARVTFGSNTRASADYRREICKVLVRRAALALGEEG